MSTESSAKDQVPGPGVWEGAGVYVGDDHYTVVSAERTIIKVPQRDGTRIERELEFVYTLHLAGGSSEEPDHGLCYGCAFDGCSFTSPMRMKVRQHVATCSHRPQGLPVAAVRTSSPGRATESIPKVDIGHLPITEIILLAQEAAGYRELLVAKSMDLAEANRSLTKIRRIIAGS